MQAQQAIRDGVKRTRPRQFGTEILFALGGCLLHPGLLHNALSTSRHFLRCSPRKREQQDPISTDAI